MYFLHKCDENPALQFLLCGKYARQFELHCQEVVGYYQCSDVRKREEYGNGAAMRKRVHVSLR